MKKLTLVLLLLFIVLFTNAQSAKQVLTKPGINSKTAIITTSEKINMISTLTSNAQDQLNAKPNIEDGEDPTLHVYFKTFYQQIDLTDAETIVWDGSVSKSATVTLGGNRTLSITNPISGIEYVLRIKQDANGARMLTWPINTTWPSGATPVLTSTGNGVDVVRLIYDGTNFNARADINLMTDLKNGLISYYAFDGATGTTDSRGTNTATFAGGLLVNQTGKLSQCISFDATDDYVSLNTNTLYDFTTAYSISFWIKTPAMLNSYVLVKAGASLTAYAIRLGGSSIRLYSEGGYFTPSSVDIGASAVFTANTWTHWVFTYNGSSVKQYKNGALINTTSVTGTILYGSTNLFLGRSNLGGNYFNGSIDELALFNREISLSEVTKIYNSGSGLAYGSW